MGKSPIDCGCDLGPPQEDVVLFVMDAPNVNGTLGEVLRHIPESKERLQFSVLMRWLQDQTDEGQRLIAKVFVNKPLEAAKRVVQYGWLDNIHREGFHFYAKPRKTPDSDVDEDMVEFIWRMIKQHRVKKLILASNDSRCFEKVLAPIARNWGAEVVILGFHKYRSKMTRNPLFTFVPYKNIPGVIPALTPKPRETEQSLRVYAAMINAEGPLTVRELIKLTGVADGTLYPMLLKRVDAGIVSPKDRNGAAEYDLTPEGYEMAKSYLLSLDLEVADWLRADRRFRPPK